MMPLRVLRLNFLVQPVFWGIVIGAPTVGVLTAVAYLLAHYPPHMAIEPFLLEHVAIPKFRTGMFWGGFLGANVARMAAAWLTDNRRLARRVGLRTGLSATAVSLGGILLYPLFNYPRPHMHNGLPEWTEKFIPYFSNAPFQLSLLILVLTLLLPRHDAERVQITETVRL